MGKELKGFFLHQMVRTSSFVDQVLRGRDFNQVCYLAFFHLNNFPLTIRIEILPELGLYLISWIVIWSLPVISG